MAGEAGTTTAPGNAAARRRIAAAGALAASVGRGWAYAGAGAFCGRGAGKVRRRGCGLWSCRGGHTQAVAAVVSLPGSAYGSMGGSLRQRLDVLTPASVGAYGSGSRCFRRYRACWHSRGGRGWLRLRLHAQMRELLLPVRQRFGSEQVLCTQVQGEACAQ